MPNPTIASKNQIKDSGIVPSLSLSGVVRRITFHSDETGWSVLKIDPFIEKESYDRNIHLAQAKDGAIAVVVHQSQVYAGATMEFQGHWVTHPKYGLQFKAERSLELKPANIAALEKYIGSGLIKGIGPKIAGDIIKHFDKEALEVFENDIERLLTVPGISKAKLKVIKESWVEHKEIKEIMMFLQSHNISTLYAVKIYKTYDNEAIKIVSENPYRLAQDIPGIGFISADKVALSLGVEELSSKRIRAAILHILARTKNDGHCFLFKEQIYSELASLLGAGYENESDRLDADKEILKVEHSISDLPDLEEQIEANLEALENSNELKVRHLAINSDSETQACYYSRSIFYDEEFVATKLKTLLRRPTIKINLKKAKAWIAKCSTAKGVVLSKEQEEAIIDILQEHFSILTGGPGCGKTTALKTLVELLESMEKEVMLAAPTGRAAQRMTEVIGIEAKTIHRLLEWNAFEHRFTKNEENPLSANFLIIDESSMIDIKLMASLMKAIASDTQVLLVGDADQLASVGAGDVLRDLINSNQVTVSNLTKIFRQAQKSLIIKAAHNINKGEEIELESPFKEPELWQGKEDCMFIDSEEATLEQKKFIHRIKNMDSTNEEAFNSMMPPAKFEHVNLARLAKAKTEAEELKETLKFIHPFSSLNYGLTATEMIKHLYLKTIPKYMGKNTEIQILSPMSKGSLGTVNLNQVIQKAINPERASVKQIKFGDKVFREGDRVIQTRNNYDLGVFNGDIGRIKSINSAQMSCTVLYPLAEGLKELNYETEAINDLELAYAISIHKSQGSEFEFVIIPIANQHFRMLYRNLIYTGLTRAKKMAVFVGSRWALSRATENKDMAKRQTSLKYLLE